MTKFAITKDGIYIKTFDSIVEAERFVNDQEDGEYYLRED